ncbi:hypothetical protein QWY14_16255 [Planococcus sp. N028]|uniref:DUF3953 domain-containing protein n=1 Tax=Planococcus shixiaomingii TaxID=3058393 RepID=A0ABT8N645_9BACL|nr:MULTISPECIES: hypothetical protein [unclassified Planococcus (in: firmicutes)]MDN7243359.1 hypothetical protein [Planococcus sp. N028]WKA55300.1 hypothetical protein QWY21_02625 [Planococcus sp. N022]
MNRKMALGISVAVLSIASLIFLIQGNLDIAVLLMTLLFVLTNSFRYQKMKSQGMEREAKWMFGMAVLFAILFVIILITILV